MYFFCLPPASSAGQAPEIPKKGHPREFTGSPGKQAGKFETRPVCTSRDSNSRIFLTLVFSLADSADSRKGKIASI
jgi:hypothetical protein